MKKLMMTTVAALGFAALAQADVLNSTGFEEYGDKDFAVNATDKGATEGHQYWTGDGLADFSQTVLKTYTEAGIAAPEKVPDAFTNAANTTFLSVDTGSAVMYRRAAANPTETINLSSAGPVFFDADVKFTASESDVVPSEGDKLLVWLKGDETTTNLVVTAGLYNELTGDYDSTNFTVDGDYAADTWYRLTVKAAVDDKNLTYFNVYIDGEPVVATDKTTNFYSLVQTGVNKYVIAEAGFQGTGALDNVVWTTTDPFPAEATYTLAVTIEDENGDLAAITVNGTEYLINGQTSLEIPFTASTTTLEVAASDIFEGMMIREWNGVSTTITVADVLEDGRIALTLTVVAGEVEVPTAGEAAAGGSATVKADDAAAAAEAVKARGVDGIVYEVSQKYYTKTAVATGTAGVFEVTVALNETALGEDVEAAVETALEAVKAGATSVALPAGFYYKVESGSELPIATTATGTTDGSEIEVKGLNADAGFFKVSVGTTNFAE